MVTSHSHGKLADEAVGWTRQNRSDKLGTLHVTGPDVGLHVVGDGPWDRIFSAVHLETGERGVIVTTSQPFRDEKAMATPSKRV